MAITLLFQHAEWKAAWKTARKDVAACVRATLKHEGAKASDVAVVLMDDAAIRPLNQTYRGKDKPTNVLSFPADEEGMLGDVLLAYETIHAEAEAQGKPLRAHAMHLVVHGVLHLLGHDHETEAEAATMERKEVNILATLGIANPYITT